MRLIQQTACDELPENAPDSFKEQKNKYTDSNTVEVDSSFSDGTFKYQITKDDENGHELSVVESVSDLM